MNKNLIIYIEPQMEYKFIDKIHSLIVKLGLEMVKEKNKANLVISNKITEGLDSIVFTEKKAEAYDNSGMLYYSTELNNYQSDVEYLFIKVIEKIYNKTPFELFGYKNKFRKKLLKFLQSLVVTMEVEDKETNLSHSQRVAFYATKFYEYIGKDKDEIEKIGELALLHDIGRIGLEQLMLFTPTRINEFETWELEHTVTGSMFLSPLDELWYAVPVVRSHHERWDGTGYPDGLKGEEIPYYARILAIIDFFDISTHTASSEYEGTMLPEESLDYIKRKSGIIFDPELSTKFHDFMVAFLKENKFV